jgi:hypothetical protein
VVFGQQVVGPDHGCVSSDIAITHQPLLQHGDPFHSMIAGKVVRRRQSMAAGTDDYNVVARLQALSAPQGYPESLAGQPGPHECQG